MAGGSHFSVFKNRGAIVAAAFVVIAGLLVAELYKMQILNYDYYQDLVIDQVTVETKETARRGNIYDTNMSVLATNVSAWRVFISPKDIDRVEKSTSMERTLLRFMGNTGAEREKSEEQSKLIARNLSDILDVDYDMIIERCSRKNRLDETIKARIDEETKDKVIEFIKAYGLENQVHVQALSLRYYPYDNLASAAIGFTGSDGNGVYGLELYYDDELTGTAGRYITAKDSYGNDMPFDFETYFKAEDGLSLITTIDVTVQQALERQLEATYGDSEPNNRVAGIVMNVKTGAILAMAVKGDFNLNDPYTLNDFYQNKLDTSGLLEDTDEYNELKRDLRLEMWSNKCVSELYEAGSTFKVITAAMALEMGVVKDTDSFYCAGAYLVPGFSTPIHCHRTWGHGAVSFRQGLQMSCNPVLMQTAERIGSKAFYDYFGAFGFLDKAGIDLPGEALTYFHAENALGPVELAVSSFGQRFKTSMVQLITSISCVANGGNLVTPHLISGLVDADGKTVYTYETEVKRQVISESTSLLINDILEESVFVQGGNTNCYVKGYRICGKTGTSEKFEILDEDGNSYLRIGSTVAYAPADDPEFAVLIVVDEPTCSNTYGSNVAAPYCAAFMEEVLPYLGIDPKYTPEELATLQMNVGNYVGLTAAEAREKAKASGLTIEIIGDGDKITNQVPSGGTYVTKGSARVILYTNNEIPKNSVKVPDVLGKSAAQASQTLLNAGLSVHVVGATDTGTAGAVVVEQSVVAGTEVPRGSCVKITMRHTDNTD
ncbi:MAG: PASTA domain-containing protein [Clostridia bacterium]|nr:PASTA domain-containing protein [Clostridia bacterium]